MSVEVAASAPEGFGRGSGENEEGGRGGSACECVDEEEVEKLKGGRGLTVKMSVTVFQTITNCLSRHAKYLTHQSMHSKWGQTAI